MNKGGKAFLAAVGLSVAGGIAFYTGIAAAFGRAGNWADDLAWFGVFLLVAAGFLNLIATIYGVVFLVRKKRLDWGPIIWWFPLSAVLSVAALIGVGSPSTCKEIAFGFCGTRVIIRLLPEGHTANSPGVHVFMLPWVLVWLNCMSPEGRRELRSPFRRHIFVTIPDPG